MAKKENTVKINDEIYKLKFLLGGDMKFLHTVMGLSACKSNFPCLWCKWPKDFFFKTKYGCDSRNFMLVKNNTRTISSLKERKRFTIETRAKTRKRANF
jgi:hypothetical protein